MKKLNILIIALLFISCKTQINDKNQFVEFIHTGMTQHIYPALIISAKKVNVPLTDEQISQLIRMSGTASITDRDKELYKKINCRTFVTDSMTFKTLNNFVFSHKSFYPDLKYFEQHPIKESFDVLVNGRERFFVNEKLKNEFIKELVDTLQQGNHDENIIKEISYWRQND